MLTRRGILLGSIAAGAIMQNRDVWAKAAQPATPVNFEIPSGACDCHTHIHGDVDFIGRQDRRTRSARNHCLEFASVADAAAYVVDHLPEVIAHRQFVDAGLIDVSAQRP